MFALFVTAKIKPGHRDEFIEATMGDAVGSNNDEPGCLRFEVYHSESDPKVFLLCERWQSEQAWKDHHEEKAFREIYQPQVMPRVERVPHISTLVE